MSNTQDARKLFEIGDYVKIAPYTDAFMQGFAYGFVRRVGRKLIVVEWNCNRRITRKFLAEHLERV
jgi:hypothetical protein